MKRTMSLMLCIWLCFSFTIVQGQEKLLPQNELVKMCAYEDLGSISPFKVSSDVQYEAVRFVFDTLYYINEDEKARQMLGSDFKNNEDFTQYTVTLRKGIKWHDGSDLTADDVVYTFNEARDNPWYKNRLMALDSISNSGNDIVFKMKHSNASFMKEAIAYVPIVPKAYYEKGEQMSIGTGPFEVSGNEVGTSQYVFDYNEGYFISQTTQKIIIDVLDSAAVCADKILEGQYLTTFGSIDPQNFAKFSSDKQQAINIYGLKSKVLFMNNKKAPTDNQYFRKAISYAIDFDKIVNDVYKTEADKGSPGFFSSRLGYSNKEDVYTLDIEKAKQLLVSGGYTYNGETIFDSNNQHVAVSIVAVSGIDSDIAFIIKENLKAIGIDVSILPAKTKEEAMDLVIVDNYLMAIMDLDNYYQSCETSLLALNDDNYANFSNINSQKFNEAKNNYIVNTMDATKRYSALMDMQKSLSDEMNFITLCYPRTLAGFAPGGYDTIAYKEGVGVYSFLSFISNKKYLAMIANNVGTTKEDTSEFKGKSLIYVVAIIAGSFAILLVYIRIRNKRKE